MRKQIKLNAEKHLRLFAVVCGNTIHEAFRVVGRDVGADNGATHLQPNDYPGAQVIVSVKCSYFVLTMSHNGSCGKQVNRRALLPRSEKSQFSPTEFDPYRHYNKYACRERSPLFVLAASQLLSAQT